jgi:hypothetical protein
VRDLEAKLDYSSVRGWLLKNPKVILARKRFLDDLVEIAIRVNSKEHKGGKFSLIFCSLFFLCVSSNNVALHSKCGTWPRP